MEEQKKILDLLDILYVSALEGLPGQKTVFELGDEYLNRYNDLNKASDKFINYQILKCTTSGFLTNVSGIIAMPIGIPANIASVLYVQLRMIATLAYMSGLDPLHDEVQTLCYVALSGKTASDLLKRMGITFGEKITTNMIGKISGASLVKINQAVGMRLITKFGEKGIINLGKGVPAVGGFIGGTFDFMTTKTIAKISKDMFINQ